MTRRDARDALRVMVIDGDALRARVACAGRIEVIGDAHTLRDAAAAGDARPDVVVVAQERAEDSPVRATRALQRWLPATAVVMVAADRDEDTLVDLIVAGAAAYVPDDLPPERLHPLLRRVAGGGVALDPWAARVLLARFGGGSAERGTGLLTAAERASLARVAEGTASDADVGALAHGVCTKVRDAAFICA